MIHFLSDSNCTAKQTIDPLPSPPLFFPLFAHVNRARFGRRGQMSELNLEALLTRQIGRLLLPATVMLAFSTPLSLLTEMFLFMLPTGAIVLLMWTFKDLMCYKQTKPHRLTDALWQDADQLDLPNFFEELMKQPLWNRAGLRSATAIITFVC